RPVEAVVELGCGARGLARRLESRCGSYLGVDSSFAAGALARHLALGAPYAAELRIPGDLLRGPGSRAVGVPAAPDFDGSADFVVGEIQSLPLREAAFDVALALNVIDMLEQPELLPELQRGLLRPGGHAIQSCPYVWRE